MHTNNLVHRDIKSDNVVYSADKAGDLNNLELKLIDFGFSKMSMQGSKNLVDMVGTPYYIAPEIIEQMPYDSKCDIWSLGVLVYQILCGEMPFNGRSRAELFKKITSGRYSFKSKMWDYVSQDARGFIRDCLTVN